MGLFKRRKAGKLIEGPLTAKTNTLIDAIKDMPARECTKVISAILRDRLDITGEDMRRLAHELDRDADRRDRDGLFRR